MKERPILFNSEMVRAILKGRKTQTRRVVKVTDHNLNILSHTFDEDVLFGDEENIQECFYKEIIKTPYQIGDRIWVRETFHVINGSRRWKNGTILYRCDSGYGGSYYDCIRWTPSIHMPRWASRITLEIKSVRVERLQDISEEDAKAEGLSVACKDGALNKYGLWEWPWQSWNKDPRMAFQRLWETVYGDESFHSNPWVWVIEFEVVK